MTNNPDRVRLIKDANAGIAGAQVNLALSYLADLNAFKQERSARLEEDPEVDKIKFEIKSWLERAKAQNFTEAYYLYALLNTRGIVHEPDRPAAEQDLFKAESLGHPDATYQLGLLYCTWLEKHERFEAAMQAFETAAQKGHPDAKLALAYGYEHGIGGEKKPQDAWQIWCELAEQGSDRAAFRVADALAESNQHLTTALSLFEKAAGAQYPAAAARATSLKSAHPELSEAESIDWQTVKALQPLSDSALDVASLSDKPKVRRIANFLNADECSHIAISALPHLKSSVVLDASGQPMEKPIRTSEEMSFIDPRRDLVICWLEQRIADYTGIPVTNGEPLVVLKYSPGKEYKIHADYFRPELPSAKVAFEFGGQRIATFICYLNDVAKGGETAFPEVGIQVAPKQGAALLFYNVDDAGDIEPLSRHAGLPVEAGNKWIITRWLRERSLPTRSNEGGEA